MRILQSNQMKHLVLFVGAVLIGLIKSASSVEESLWQQMDYQTMFLAPRGGSETGNGTFMLQSGAKTAPQPPNSSSTKPTDYWTSSLSSMGQTLYDKLWKPLDADRPSFMEGVGRLAQNLWLSEPETSLEDEEGESMDLDAVTPQTDLTRPGRHFTIITTAALPWMTGTAINPLLRAAHLVRHTQRINGFNNDNSDNSDQWVTLVIPWLELPADQTEVYRQVFSSPQEQEQYVRNWLRDQANMPDAADPETGLNIIFYPARYHSGLKSIFAMGDICNLVQDDKADVCILEEPEHLNWYRAPTTEGGYTTKFSYVIGVVHTNYKEYASSQYHGLWSAPAIALLSSAMVRAYCHKVIKLSDVLQSYAVEKESTSNVHGVRQDYLIPASQTSPRKAYFVGKLLWTKGLDIMLELQEYYKEWTGDYFPIDIYGSGPDQRDIERAFLGRKRSQECASDTDAPKNERESNRIVLNTSAGGINTAEVLQKALDKLDKIRETIRRVTPEDLEIPKTLHELRRQPIPSTFPGRVDHALLRSEYSVFVNPSVSEVLCTTTAEALAMGKFVVIPVHPSNNFFLRFPNCLAYRNKLEFAANLRWALSHDPEPLTPELRREFSWEAATDRLIEASAVTHKEARSRRVTKLDERIAWFHNELGKGVKGDRLRKVLGAGPASGQVEYERRKGKQDQQPNDDGDQGEEKEMDNSSNNGRASHVADAIRNTVASGLPTLLV